MVISVDIADRLYDYTDEEKAAEAVADFQDQNQLGDEDIVTLWTGPADPKRDELERRLFEAVDKNGSAARAATSVPNGITLFIE